MKTHKDMDEYDKLKAEEVAKLEVAVYETLEDDIMDLRSTIKAQAILLKEMGPAGFQNFFDRIILLEKLQCKYDEWEPVLDDTPKEHFADV